jgi:hypothetical protein
VHNASIRAYDAVSAAAFHPLTDLRLVFPQVSDGPSGRILAQLANAEPSRKERRAL